MRRVAAAVRWFLAVLCVLSACAAVIVGIDEICSRNEAEWAGGGGRHATEGK